MGAAALCALASASVTTRAQNPPHWQIGDVFVGVGSDMTPSGKFVVYDEDGNFKETLTDTTGQYTITTGCMVAPPVGTHDESLYFTNFYGPVRSDPFSFPEAGSFGPTVTRFAVAHPHASAIATTIPHPDVIASESIVFDRDGNYYVGGIVGPFDGTEYANAYIFKYSPTNQLLATYEVPNGRKGADWIDLGPDGTLYYTSEGTRIHWFKPALATGNSAGDQFGVIPITYAGAEVGGTSYAMRVLPPLPNGQPSGFLVAMSGAIVRLDPQGVIIHTYTVNTQGGTFFALNISHDGKTFWTATEQPDTETACCDEFGNDLVDAEGFPVPVAPARAFVYKFHLGTGQLLLGPIDASAQVSSAFSVKGLCVKREYTAATNQCYRTNSLGDLVLDGSGNPIAEECVAREICNGNQPGDDDGDGLADALDSDCALPGAPEFTLQIPDTQNSVGDVVAGYPSADRFPLAVSPLNLPLTYSASFLPAGISIDPATGRMSGTLLAAADRPQPWTVTVTVSDGTRSAGTTFNWLVTGHNRPPELSSTISASATTHASPFTVTILRPHVITLRARDSRDPVFVAASHRRIGETDWRPGLPGGYRLLNPRSTGTAPTWMAGAPSGVVPAGFQVLGTVDAAGVADVPFTIGGPPTEEGAFEVWVAITDDVGDWGTAPHYQQLEARDWLRAAQNQKFTITVVNIAPHFTTLVVPPKDHLIGTAIPGVTEIVAGDADSHLPLSFTIANNPTGTSMGLKGGTDNTGVLSGVPTVEVDPGAQVQIVVRDLAGKPAAAPIAFTWRVYNTAPAITCPANRSTVATRSTISLQLAGTDPDPGHSIKAGSWSVSGLPAGLSLDAQTGLISGSPITPVTDAVVTVNATDTWNKPAPTCTFRWSVTNGAPEFTVADKTSPVAVAASVDIDATDPDGHTPLTYSAVLPSWLTIDASTGVISGTAPTTTGAPIPISVTVTDDLGVSTTKSFTWTLTNASPEFEVANQSSIVGFPASYTISATDPDGHAVSYEITGVPAGLTVSGNTISGTPSVVAGPQTVTVTARDEFGGSTTKTFTWAVTNRAPTFTVVNQSTVIGAPASYTIAATDPDGHTVSYVISGQPLGFTVSGNVISGTPAALGTSTITVTASDPHGGSETKTFTWTIFNNAPVFVPTPPPDRETLVGTAVSVQIVAQDTDHASHLPLTYAFSGLPLGLVGASNGLVTGVAALPTGFSERDSTVTVTATDRFGAPRSATFRWRVFTNRPPVCTATAPSVATLWPPDHRMVAVSILGVTDPDGDALTITATGIQQDEPTNTVGDGNTSSDGSIVNGVPSVRAERSGTPAVPGDGRVYQIFFTASDGRATCTGSVKVGVPHDLGQRSVPIDSLNRYDSLTGAAISVVTPPPSLNPDPSPASSSSTTNTAPISSGVGVVTAPLTSTVSVAPTSTGSTSTGSTSTGSTSTSPGVSTSTAITGGSTSTPLPVEPVVVEPASSTPPAPTTSTASSTQPTGSSTQTGSTTTSGSGAANTAAEPTTTPATPAPTATSETPAGANQTTTSTESTSGSTEATSGATGTGTGTTETSSGESQTNAVDAKGADAKGADATSDAADNKPSTAQVAAPLVMVVFMMRTFF